jgi:hypothetical protein
MSGIANRRAFLALSIGVTSKLALDAISINQSIAQKVMGVGRGRLLHHDADGHSFYVPTPETIRRAEEMHNYYRAHAAAREILLLVSGGIVERPPQGSSEAAFMRDYLLERNPDCTIAVEDKSVNTFDNFIKSIEARHLVPGEFDPDNPLAISASRCHSWRIAAIAEQALALPRRKTSLFRLRDGNLENGFVRHTQEHIGYALTRLALAEVAEGGAEPGNLEHTREAAQLFNEWTQNGLEALGKISCSPRALVSLMTAPDIPVAVY